MPPNRYKYTPVFDAEYNASYKYMGHGWAISVPCGIDSEAVGTIQLMQALHRMAMARRMSTLRDSAFDSYRTPAWWWGCKNTKLRQRRSAHLARMLKERTA